MKKKNNNFEKINNLTNKHLEPLYSAIATDTRLREDEKVLALLYTCIKIIRVLPENKQHYACHLITDIILGKKKAGGTKNGKKKQKG